MKRLRGLRALSTLALIIAIGAVLGTLLQAVIQSHSLAGVAHLQRTLLGVEAARFPRVFWIGAFVLLALALFGRPAASMIERGGRPVLSRRAVVRLVVLLLCVLAALVLIRTGAAARLLVGLRSLRLPALAGRVPLAPIAMVIAVLAVVAVGILGDLRSTSGRSSAIAIRRRDGLIVQDLRQREPLTVQQVIAQLDTRKAVFLDEVEEAVRSYIAAQGKGCLEIVERWSDGSVYKTWELSPTPAYAGRLYHFLRGEMVDGHALDSGLTDPVMALVSSKFEDLHRDMGEIIAGEMLRSDLLAACLADNIIRSHALQYVGRQARSKAADLIVQHVRLIVEHKTGLTAAAVGTLAAQVAVVLYQHFGSAVTVVLIKALHTAAVQKALLVVGKKYVLMAVLPAAVKALLAKVGFTVTAHGMHAAATVVLVPVILGFIGRDIYRFPRELGEKVAKQVRYELEGQYTETNRRIAMSLYAGVVESLADAGIDEFMKSLLQAPEVDSQIAELATSLAHAH